MAKFGREFVRGATNPAFLGGMMTAFQNVGSAPRRRREAEEQEKKEQAVRQTIDLGMRATQNNDVVNLKRAAQKLNDLGMYDRAEILSTRAMNIEKAEKAAYGTALENRGKQQLVGFGTTAGVDLTDPKTRQAFFGQGRAYKLDPSETLETYKKLVELQQSGLGDEKSLHFVTKEVLQADGSTKIQSVGLNPMTGKEVSRTTIGTVGAGEDKPNVVYKEVVGADGVLRHVAFGLDNQGNQLFETALGKAKTTTIDTTDYDLTPKSTETDFDRAIMIATSSGRNEDARNLEEQRQIRFPDRPSTNEVIEVATAVNPMFADDLKRIRQSEQINNQIASGIDSGTAPIVERMITDLFPNDIKAVQELQRFTSAKSLPRRFVDALTKLGTGNLSKATLTDYKAIGELVSLYSKDQINNTVEILYKDDENDIADRLYKMYLEDENDAEIISSK